MRKTLATAAAAVVAIGLGSGTAGALAFGTYSDAADPHAQSTVRLLLPAGNGLAECTGTAVGEQWVLTAQHCIDGASVGGTVTTGRGADTATFRINAWEKAPVGDMALIHVTEPMGVPVQPIASAPAPVNSTATAYGWSSLGMGASGQLPKAEVSILEYGEESSYGANAPVYMTKTELPTQLQQGDSGSPIFQDGQVIGVLSMGISDIPFIPPTVTGLYIHVQTAPQYGWMQQVLGTNPTQPAPEAPLPGLPEFPMPLPSSSDIFGIFGSVDLGSVLPEDVAVEAN